MSEPGKKHETPDVANLMEGDKILGQFDTAEEFVAATGATEYAPEESTAPPASDEVPGTDQGGEQPVTELQVPEPPKTSELLSPERMGQFFNEAVENNGTLTDESYTALEGAGMPRAVVDQFIAGQQALRQSTISTVENAVGGPDVVKKALDWAQNSLSAEERTRVNADLANSSPQAQAVILRDLASRAGIVPNALGATGTHTGERPYGSQAEFLEAQQHPDYRTSTAYRETVMRRLKASMNAGTV